MIAVMTAKWVGDAQGIDGIYAVWVAMRHYPWLPPVDSKDIEPLTGEGIMKGVDKLIIIEDGTMTVSDLGMFGRPLLGGQVINLECFLEKLLSQYEYSGFPVVRGQELVGYTSREKLQGFLSTSFLNPNPFMSRVDPSSQRNIDALPHPPSSASRRCVFSPPSRRTIFSSTAQPEHASSSTNRTTSPNSEGFSTPDIIDIPEMTAATKSQSTSDASPDPTIDFSSTLDSTILQLRKEVPRELVVAMFQKMVRGLNQLSFDYFVLTFFVGDAEQHLREILFTEGGRLEGMVTKREITNLLTYHFDHTGALQGSERP